MSLSSAQKQWIVQSFAAGNKTEDIAQWYGISPHSVRRLASQAGVKKGTSVSAEQAETWGRVFENAARRLPKKLPGDPVSHLVIPDTQCKPGVDLAHLYWAGRYAAERKPDVIVHLGDHWDMPSLSSYDKRGSKTLENSRYSADIDAGNLGLELFEEGLDGWQPKRKVLLRGNHEDRITRAIEDDPRLEGALGFHHFNDTKLGWEVIDYLVPVEIDELTYCHYFYQPNTGRAYSGSVDTMLRNIGASFVMGHQQGLRVGRRELSSGHTQRGLVAGSFYQHKEDYRGPQAAFEWRGVLVLHEVADGNYDLMEVSMNYLKGRYGS